jgi:hypothetical protein
MAAGAGCLVHDFAEGLLRFGRGARQDHQHWHQVEHGGLERPSLAVEDFPGEL